MDGIANDHNSEDEEDGSADEDSLEDEEEGSSDDEMDYILMVWQLLLS